MFPGNPFNCVPHPFSSQLIKFSVLEQQKFLRDIEKQNGNKLKCYFQAPPSPVEVVIPVRKLSQGATNNQAEVFLLSVFIYKKCDFLLFSANSR